MGGAKAPPISAYGGIRGAGLVRRWRAKCEILRVSSDNTRESGKQSLRLHATASYCDGEREGKPVCG